jgi:alanine-glyoxylate transaminase/serine-glyoxylate transaminase/serine-pyruvate transaminase
MSDRTLLMIPGPVELDPEVLRALARPQLGHMDPVFGATFGRVLARLRVVVGAPDAQPFVLSGSGTMGLEMAAANVVEAGDRAVVVNTGFFADRMGAILERLGARVEHVRAPLGDVPDLAAVERALAEPARVLAVTHVDTSTGVRAPVAELARLGQAHGALVLVDGVCAVGGEDLRMKAWGVDLVATASQKALGGPPGAAVVVAGPRALAARRARKHPPGSLYVDFESWLPTMAGYEGGAPNYFATPPINVIMALDVSLGQGLDARLARHARVAAGFRAAWRALGLTMVPLRPEITANTLSAVYYPDGVDAALVGRVRAEGVIIAGGIHPAARARYFRVGHMGAHDANDALAAVGAIERALGRTGPGVAAAQEAMAAASS